MQWWGFDGHGVQKNSVPVTFLWVMFVSMAISDEGSGEAKYVDGKTMVGARVKEKGSESGRLVVGALDVGSRNRS